MRRRRSRGQAMTELAILLPLMMVLFLGSWTATDLLGANDTAVQATRAGARYAAELGNGGYPNDTPLAACQSNAADPCAVDEAIIQQMLPIVTGKMPNTVVTEIDIYEPSGAGCGTFVAGTCPPNNGAYTPAPSAKEPINEYKISGTTVTPPSTYNSCSSTEINCYTLDLRDQIHPDESELGVRILFTYTSPTLSMFTQSDSQYTVIRLAPVE